jgi:hypothetical protein
MPTFAKSGRSYTLDGVPLPSVTTLLKAGFPAPALVDWAARETAGYAVDHWEELDAAPASERLRTLETAARRRRDSAAIRGTELHAIGDQISLGIDVPVPPAYEQVAQLYADWLDAWDAEIVASERPVLYDANGVAGSSISYAGTFDLIADLNDGNRWLLDIKTGKGVYDSHVLQLAAYRYATHYLHATGDLMTMHPVDRCGVIHVRPDAVTLVPVAADEEAFETFRHVCAVALYGTKTKQAWSAGDAWPVGRAIYPKAS